MFCRYWFCILDLSDLVYTPVVNKKNTQHAVCYNWNFQLLRTVLIYDWRLHEKNVKTWKMSLRVLIVRRSSAATA